MKVDSPRPMLEEHLLERLQFPHDGRSWLLDSIEHVALLEVPEKYRYAPNLA